METALQGNEVIVYDNKKITHMRSKNESLLKNFPNDINAAFREPITSQVYVFKGCIQLLNNNLIL